MLDIDSEFKNADAVIILTEWDDYRDIDWLKISNTMRQPSWVFDTRLITNPIKVRDAGLNLWRLGEMENYKNSKFNFSSIFFVSNTSIFDIFSNRL